MVKKAILVVIGTRPEAIKLSPVIRKLENSDKFHPVVVSTGQHGSLLDLTLQDLQLKPDFNLSIMKESQTLVESASKILLALQPIVESKKPCATIVQGDTTSALMGALASFYNQVPVCHVEAGLRTENLYLPFPEEANRRLISVISKLHFSPTLLSTKTLLSEGYSEFDVIQTGNTGIDALISMKESILENKINFPKEILKISALENLILLTCHRRETFGKPIREVCDAIASLAESNKELNFIFPVHPNPNVLNVVKTRLGNHTNIHLTPPIPYSQLVLLLLKARVIITDSGGIQEEAPTLGKRTIVLRNLTERSEAVDNGMASMVGTDKTRIIEAVMRELSQNDGNLNLGTSIFGTGNASEIIVRSLEAEFG
jgi:UDP-N-acetylglucosamine 2-epimerase (non-hydrolysing)